MFIFNYKHQNENMWARFYILIYQTTVPELFHWNYLKYAYLLNIALNYVLFVFSIVKYNNSIRRCTKKNHLCYKI